MTIKISGYRKLVTSYSQIEDVFTADKQVFRGDPAKGNDTYIELENGDVIKSCRDGRYYDSENIRWEALILQEFDEDDEPVIGELLGYIKMA